MLTKMAFVCHITYGDTKKVVKFSDHLPNNIISEIKGAFNIEDFGLQTSLKLQKYEEDWKDWVDVTPSELKQGLKIKVVPPMFSPLEEVHSPGSASTILLESSTSCDDDDLDSLSMPIFELPMAGSTHSNSSTGDDASVPKTSPQPPKPSATEVFMSPDSNDKDVDKNDWPKKFELPPLPRRLAEKLNKGIFPDERERRLIISCVFNEMSGFVTYPTSAQYNEVAALLVQNFPVLREENFSSTPYYYWKIRIMDKFRNERKNLLKKRKPEKETPTSIPSTSKVQKTLLTGEDAASIVRHQKWLQEEAKKKKKDAQKISLLMGKTFLSRREDILNHPEKVSFWKEKYPLLFDSKEIVKEFWRITDRNPLLTLKDAVKQFMNVLDNKSRVENDDVLCAYQEKVKTLKEEDDVNDLRCTTVLLILPSCFKEDINSVFVLDNQNSSDKPLSSEPVLLGTGHNHLDAKDMYIMAENAVVCEVSSIIQGFECLIATYYAFNISFPQKCKKLLLFLDLMLGSKAKKIPRSLATFITKYKDK